MLDCTVRYIAAAEKHKTVDALSCNTSLLLLSVASGSRINSTSSLLKGRVPVRRKATTKSLGDTPSLASVPPRHLALGAVQQEGSQPGPADSLLGDAAYPRCWWANEGWGQGEQVRGQTARQRKATSKQRMRRGRITDDLIIPLLSFCS